jgi:integrase
MTDISASGAGNRAREGSLFKKTVLPNTFYLTSRHEIAFLNSMTTETVKKKARWCWRKDLAEFRGLTDRERTGFLLVLEWFENYRLRTIHEVLGHEDITTTEIYLHVAIGAHGLGVVSPLDALEVTGSRFSFAA